MQPILGKHDHMTGVAVLLDSASTKSQAAGLHDSNRQQLPSSSFHMHGLAAANGLYNRH